MNFMFTGHESQIRKINLYDKFYRCGTLILKKEINSYDLEDMHLKEKIFYLTIFNMNLI